MERETAAPVRKHSVTMTLSGKITGIVRDNLLGQVKIAEGREELSYFTLLINSPGGPTRFGGELFETLIAASYKHVIELATHNLNRTDSAAVCLFCAGTRRSTAENGTFLLHGASFSHFDGETQEMREMGERDETEQTNLMAEIIAKSTGKSMAIIRDILRAGENRDAQFAKDIGLVHEIGPYLHQDGAEIVDLTKRCD